MNQANKWANQYKSTIENPVYPTEWVIRTIAGANYPNYRYDKERYKGKKILDMSCGDGRNLQLLLNLGFEVYATEISKEITEGLSSRFPMVKFFVGLNHSQPFPDSFFDYVLACGSFYYLDHELDFNHNLKELNRILKPSGMFFANMARKDTYILNGAKELGNGEYLILNDPHNFRNGYRWQVVNSEIELKELVKLYLSLKALAINDDNFFGYIISSYIMVCENRKA